MSRWRSVRDNYVRNLKKQAEFAKEKSHKKKPKPYTYAQYLTFLNRNKRYLDESQTTLECNTTTTTRDIEEDEEAIASLEDVHYDDEFVEETDDIAEPVIVDFVDEQKIIKTNSIEDDDDLAFSYSILQDIKALNPEEKINFRMETIQLLQNITESRSIQLNSHTTTTTVRPRSSRSVSPSVEYDCEDSSEKPTKSIVDSIENVVNGDDDFEPNHKRQKFCLVEELEENGDDEVDPHQEKSSSKDDLDEIDLFGRLVAAQLRTLPTTLSMVNCQKKISAIIADERIAAAFSTTFQ